LRISKVFNNNVVLGVDDAGGEVVLIGRGLGFQAKPGDDVDHDRVERTFAPSEGQTPERIAAFLGEIPMTDIALTEEIVALGAATLRAACLRFSGCAFRPLQLQCVNNYTQVQGRRQQHGDIDTGDRLVRI